MTATTGGNVEREGGGVRVRVMGVTDIAVDGQVITHSATRLRAVLAALALFVGRSATLEELVGVVWAGSAPASAPLTLQGYIADLRSMIEPQRAPRTQGRFIRTVGRRYQLDVPRVDIDWTCFSDAARAALHEAPPFRLVGEQRATPGLEVIAQRLDRLLQARALWGGVPFIDLGDASPAVLERARLEDLLVSVDERALTLRLALGESDVAAAELEALTSSHPLRERLWMLRALALYRANRQGDALGVLRVLRETLIAELGVEPSPETRQLQQAILTHDAALMGGSLR